MNWSHLGAILWLRWRILVNRTKRAGKLGHVFFGVLLVLSLCASLGAFFLALALGIELLPEYKPLPLLLAWIALALGFLFFWMIGLLTDLQRSDAMSFKNLLHLPVSLGWIFLYNYLSSFVSLSVVLFLPAMLGLSLAMGIVHGPAMLVAVPLVLGYFGMITALTYQLRGWLARVMENKRRGRNIVAAITVGFIILLQVPNLINMSSAPTDRKERRRARVEQKELHRAASEEGPGQSAAQAELARQLAEQKHNVAELDRKVTLATRIIPLGWLPYGMRATFEGRWLQGLLCSLGLLSISAASLRRSHGKTLASVLGAHAEESGAEVDSPEAGRLPGSDFIASDERETLLVQRTLPFVDERTAAIVFATLRSLLRAPEAKLMLLSPVLLVGLFGVMISRNPERASLGAFAPLMSLGAIATVLVSISQLMQNQFGLDRAGYRAYVLSPVPRQQILQAKNIANAPIGLGFGLIALGGLQVFVPADVVHFLGACIQLISAYLLLCLVGNVISILGPMRLKEHGLKAANAKWKAALWQLLSMLTVPAVLSPLLLPAGLEWLLQDQAWARGLPLYLVLHALAAIGLFFLYRQILKRQGALLQRHEQRILDVLTRD